MPSTELLVIDPAACRSSFIEHLQSARESIHLSLFRCDDSAIVAELNAARRRGVDVRVLMTNRAKRSMRQLDELFLAFQRDGIRAIRYAGPHERYHAKYAIVDGRVALVSSMNLTRDRFIETDDFLLLTVERDIVAGLRELFHVDWSGTAACCPVSPRLIISPDSARTRLSRIIDNAHTSLLIVDHKLDDERIVESIAHARQRGVDVQLLTDRRRFGLKAHAKVMIVDDCLAVAGSLALSENTLDRRRDLAIVIESPPLVEQLAMHLRGISERQCA